MPLEGEFGQMVVNSSLSDGVGGSALWGGEWGTNTALGAMARAKLSANPVKGWNVLRDSVVGATSSGAQSRAPALVPMHTEHSPAFSAHFLSVSQGPTLGLSPSKHSDMMSSLSPAGSPEAMPFASPSWSAFNRNVSDMSDEADLISSPAGPHVPSHHRLSPSLAPSSASPNAWVSGGWDSAAGATKGPLGPLKHTPSSSSPHASPLNTPPQTPLSVSSTRYSESRDTWMYPETVFVDGCLHTHIHTHTHTYTHTYTHARTRTDTQSYSYSYSYS
jgi:hypothetical protein